MLRAISKASPTLLAMPLGGWRRSSFASICWKRSRSSARSMESTEVPMSGAPARSRPFARFSGVCPPNCTMIPSGWTTSTTFITSSCVRGSKNR